MFELEAKIATFAQRVRDVYMIPVDVDFEKHTINFLTDDVGIIDEILAAMEKYFEGGEIDA